MKLSDLLNRRIVVLSGKGGVGKSVLTATLAWIASRTGKRVLIVELDTIETIPHFFGVSGVESYKEIPLYENISSFHIDGKSALQEYLRLMLKSKKVTERIFRSPVYQYFVEVAPGLKELMTIGKIWDMEQATLPGSTKPRFDLFVVDTPATGHTSSYFRMPQTAVKTIRRGFVKKEAQKVADLLQDPEKVLFNIVTTLEEMPVNEALELYSVLVNELELPVGCIFANKMYPAFPEGELQEEYNKWKSRLIHEPDGEAQTPSPLKRIEPFILMYAESWRKRRSDNEFYLERLKAAVPYEIHPVPRIFSSNVNTDFIQELAQGMIAGSGDTFPI